MSEERIPTVGLASSILKFGAEDQDALRDYWEVFNSHSEDINRTVLNAIHAQPEFAALLRSVPAEKLAEQQRRSREIARKAFTEGDWDAYLNNLRVEGEEYARVGISFSGLFELLSAYRQEFVGWVFQAYCQTPERCLKVLNVNNRLNDATMAILGEAYLSAKQKIIQQQQEAIRELSTPVLRFRDRLLILPIIGMLDSHRAQQLTEQLLHGIREHRARVVVIDITGVPTVDSMVANHLIKTVEAARLMGARALVTGLSVEIAQTLVRIGVDLGRLHTMSDLQSGIEEADRILGYRLICSEPEPALADFNPDGLS